MRWAVQKLYEYAEFMRSKETLTLRHVGFFFASSHSKFPCDEIGETVIRLEKTASLQRPLSGHILTPQALFEYCCDYVSGISFEFLNADNMQKDRLRLASRFLLGNTIPGTRSFHHFEPLSNSSIGYRRTSEDSGLTGIQYFSNDDHDNSNVNGNDYILCKYDGKWWLGLVEEINNIEQKAYVKFMHPPGPSNAYFGSKRLMHVGFHFSKFM